MPILEARALSKVYRNAEVPVGGGADAEAVAKTQKRGRPRRQTLRAVPPTLFAACLLLAPLARPQEVRVGASIDVSIVNVDVIVSDRQGHRIAGLTQSDFTIAEDGKPQAITNFTEYAAATRDERPREKRTIIVFIEPFTMAPERVDRVFGAIKQMLRVALHPGDAATIVEWRRKLIIREPLTDNVGQLVRTIDSIAAGYPSVGTDPAQELIIARERIRRWLSEARDPFDRGSISLLDGRTEAGDALHDMRRKTAAINALITQLAGVDGRKALVMLTHRFSAVAGGEFMFNASSSNAPLLPADARERYGTAALIDSIIANANANGVTVYPFFAEGMGSVGLTGAEYRGGTFREVQNFHAVSGYDFWVLTNETPVLTRVADETGGMAAWGSTNVANALPTVGADLEVYYSLAYRAGRAGQDRARKILVKVNNPDYVVRHRRQYVEKSDDTRVRDRVLANLFQPVASSTIPFRTTVGAAQKKRAGHFVVPLTLQIPICSLTLMPAQHGFQASFSVYVAWGGMLGEAGGVTRRSHTFIVAASDLERAKSSYYRFDVDVMADDRTGRLSIGVVDESSRDQGFAEVALPDGR